MLYDSIFIKLNNFSTQDLNGLRYLFHSLCCTTQQIIELMHVYDPNLNYKLKRPGLYVNMQ